MNIFSMVEGWGDGGDEGQWFDSTVEGYGGPTHAFAYLGYGSVWHDEKQNIILPHFMTLLLMVTP